MTESFALKVRCENCAFKGTVEIPIGCKIGTSWYDRRIYYRNKYKINEIECPNCKCKRTLRLESDYYI